MPLSPLSPSHQTAVREPFRPHFHFTPPQNWLNDPNGMVYFEGEYHLFYQYHPHSTVWGPMHWGHAVSQDLIHWEHLPIALAPDEKGMIFSGSAVIDWANTAAFGPQAMIAIFTYHQDDPRAEVQGIAYSVDNGRTWTKYAGNPVLTPATPLHDFRDPKVFWYQAADKAGHWVMALAAGNEILFYTSPDLKKWTPSGRFGNGYGSVRGVWETPDLFRLPIVGREDTRWVLTVGVGEGAPAGGSGMQYFVGTFDGQTFTSENAADTILWADYGADFYAAQSWNGAPNGRKLWLAWMNNWLYARDIPTGTWRGAMTLPRELTLADTSSGLRLKQTAVPELHQLRRGHHAWQDVTLLPEQPFRPDVQGQRLEILLEMATPKEASSLGLRLCVGDEEATVLRYAPESSTLYVDRTQSGQSDFYAGFAAAHLARLEPTTDRLKLHIFVDHSSVEIFANDGLVTFTERIFPSAGSTGIVLFCEGTAVTVHKLEIYELAAAQFTGQSATAASVEPPPA
ncbi:MAG: glycoside hydrolase family 32 protein [Ardenticatenaceae bacterium]|nr:glycoside hydrolase family 32 protein [Ardenticatenaceae bacterium]